MLLTEIFGELLAVEFVKMLAGIGEFVCAAHHQGVVWIVDDTFEFRHLLRVDERSYMVADEQQS